MKTPTTTAMNPNDKLTRYWRRKRKALLDFLNNTNPAPTPVGSYLTVLQKYINDLTTPAGGVGKSLEEDLNLSLTEVLKKNEYVTTGFGPPAPGPPPAVPPKEKRRSARLTSMVQGVVGFTRSGSGFYATVGDVAHHAPGGAHGFKEYVDSVEAASIAAAKFLEAGKNSGNASAIFDALDALLPANKATMDQWAYDELEGLRLDIDSYVNRGGTGDGSGYWPSVYVSSSTASTPP